MSEPTEPTEAPPSKSVRKPYRPPRLIEYGPVEKLTHSGTGTSGDGGPMMMPCL
jgi:hypothetical protein